MSLTISLPWRLLLCGMLLLAPLSDASAQSTQPPANCSPQGTATCSNKLPPPWQYSWRDTCGPAPIRSTDEAVRQDIYNGYWRSWYCGLTVAPNGGWLTGGPHVIGGCGTSLNYSSLPVYDGVTGTEVLNYKFLNVDWTEPLPSCTTNGHAAATIAKFRDMACPPGMTPLQGYCVTEGASPPKDLGEGGRCALTPNPIHIKTGNKFQVETDYSGVDGLEFKRFYNHGGVTEDTARLFGENWFTPVVSQR